MLVVGEQGCCRCEELRKRLGDRLYTYVYYSNVAELGTVTQQRVATAVAELIVRGWDYSFPFVLCDGKVMMYEEALQELCGEAPGSGNSIA